MRQSLRATETRVDSRASSSQPPGHRVDERVGASPAVRSPRTLADPVLSATSHETCDTRRARPRGVVDTSLRDRPSTFARHAPGGRVRGSPTRAFEKSLIYEKASSVLPAEEQRQCGGARKPALARGLGLWTFEHVWHEIDDGQQCCLHPDFQTAASRSVVSVYTSRDGPQGSSQITRSGSIPAASLIERLPVSFEGP